MSNNIVSGFDNDDKARNLLLKAGVMAFRVTAGYIPKKGDNFDDLPAFKIVSNEEFPAFRAVNCIAPSGYTYISHVRFGDWDKMVLQCTEPLCYDCAWSMKAYFNFNFEIRWEYSDETCCACGHYCYDTIPF